MVRISSATFPMETTLALIKPDALESGFKKEILYMIHKYKFTILKAGRFKLTKLRAEEFYDEHCKKACYYDPMIKYMMRLRALFGKNGQFNAVHGSNSAESAIREIKIFFPDMILEPYLTKPLASEFYSKAVHPVLVKALAALVKEKPSGESIAKWLARWLHEHNPKIPKFSNDVIPNSMLKAYDPWPPYTRPPMLVWTSFAPGHEFYKHTVF